MVLPSPALRVVEVKEVAVVWPPDGLAIHAHTVLANIGRGPGDDDGGLALDMAVLIGTVGSGGPAAQTAGGGGTVGGLVIRAGGLNTLHGFPVSGVVQSRFEVAVAEMFGGTVDDGLGFEKAVLGVVFELTRVASGGETGGAVGAEEAALVVDGLDAGERIVVTEGVGGEVGGAGADHGQDPPPTPAPPPSPDAGHHPLTRTHPSSNRADCTARPTHPRASVAAGSCAFHTSLCSPAASPPSTPCPRSPPRP